MRHSIGRTLPAGVTSEVLLVPNGYIADVSLIFISNTSGSTSNITLYWQHGHDPSHQIYILSTKTISSKDYLQLSNGNVVMKSGDSLQFLPSSEMNIIVTFDLLKAPQLFTFPNE
jgi:hypothetical protein